MKLGRRNNWRVNNVFISDNRQLMLLTCSIAIAVLNAMFIIALTIQPSTNNLKTECACAGLSNFNWPFDPPPSRVHAHVVWAYLGYNKCSLR